MKITGHNIEKLYDPTGILSGDRYELFLNLDVPEDDELFSEHGLSLRVIFAVDENDSRIIQYNFYEQGTNQILDFALEDEEIDMVTQYCTDLVNSQ